MLVSHRLRKACAVALIIGFPIGAIGQDVGAPATHEANQELTLTLPQARALAQTAIRNGQPVLAYNLSEGLLRADPSSSFAHFVRATAQAQLGKPNDARRSAARAYRFADSKLHRFEAAELAARMSYAQKQPTITQLWLRRAVQNAPDKQIEAQLARDFKRVRAENPLTFSIRGSLRPSNNVNNGADSGVQVIDGLPFTGLLSGSAQALSGTNATLDTRIGYRLRGTRHSRTQIGARLYVSRVALSSDARRLAPTLDNADLGTAYAEVSLSHGFAVGNQGGSADLGAAYGQLWSGGNKYYDFARLDAERTWRLDENTKFVLKGSAERRASALATLADSNALSLLTEFNHQRSNEDRITLALELRHTDSQTRNQRTTSASLRASYSFGQQIGPAKITAGLVLSHAEYPDFATVFAVPGGRQDNSAYASLTFLFPDVDYAGFAPTVHVRAGRKFSNVSRYETRELSVSLGIQSKF